MPYSRDWDESFPPGTELANTLDTIIQHFKTDVRERIEQVIPGWTDEGEDPKRAVIRVGLLDNRPSSSNAHAGEFYFAIDEDILYLFFDGSWVILIEGTGGDDNGDDPGGPPGTFTPFNKGITLATRDWGGSSGLRTIGLFEEPEEQPVRSLRSISMRIFSALAPWNGRYAHGMHSRVDYEALPSQPFWRIDSVSSVISGPNRLYIAAIFMDGNVDGDVEVELEWSFWQGDFAPTFPEVEEED